LIKARVAITIRKSTDETRCTLGSPAAKGHTMRFAARRRLALLALAAASLLAAGLSGTAQAQSSPLTDQCAGQQLSRPFLPWLDLDSYTLAGDGGFEAGASGWTLSGGATVVSGNEPWHVRGATDAQSLNLPVGASATSPAVCIGLLDPTARLFARSLGGTLEVDATVNTGAVSAVVPVGVIAAGSKWAPTSPLPVLANLTTLVSNGTGSVTFSFTALGGGVQIDDLYVDPFKVN
jgi:hypothetical protein